MFYLKGVWSKYCKDADSSGNLSKQNSALEFLLSFLFFISQSQKKYLISQSQNLKVNNNLKTGQFKNLFMVIKQSNIFAYVEKASNCLTSQCQDQDVLP